MNWLRAHRFEILLGLVLLVVLVPLLMPGYVLTLDMVFTPTIPAPQPVAGAYRNGWAVRWVLHLLTLVIPGWVVQKMVFIALFGGMAASAYYCIAPRASGEVRSVVAALYVVNPFVYTRLLAGQWLILAAYAVLPLVFHAADDRMHREWSSWKRGGMLGAALALVCAGSLHLDVMAILIAGIQTVVTMTEYRGAWRKACWTATTFLLATSYWTIPALTHSGPSVVESFDERHVLAFAPTVAPQLGALGTVLALYGFWGEREPWARAFVWPYSVPVLAVGAGLVLAGTVLVGGWKSRASDRQRELVGMVVLGVLALVFSVGVAPSVTQSLSAWMFAHVEFWSGFRDSQKWSAVLVLVYAWFVGQALHGAKPRWLAPVLIAVLAYTFPMVGGWGKALRSVWYPEDWVRANDILSTDPHCKVLVLPWHMYYAPSWNNDRLVANPAATYFSCEVVTSRNVELRGIRTQGPIDPAYDALDAAISGRDPSGTQLLGEILRSQGIGYVIIGGDARDTWPIYEWTEQNAQKLLTGPTLTLYRRVE